MQLSDYISKGLVANTRLHPTNFQDQQHQGGKLSGKGLGRSDTNLDTGQCRQEDIGLTNQRGGSNVTQGQTGETIDFTGFAATLDIT